MGAQGTDVETIARLTAEINQLKKERRAVLLAHVYQRPEVQEVADFTGDSLQLAQQAAKTDADVIVFCGVHFMAESAAILAPEKTVLLPDQHAGCPMADMVTAEALVQKKKAMPDAVVVAYVNTSAAVKAECDICCTSSNALKVVASLPEDRPILFLPDRNLGDWVMKRTGRAMTLWPGYCNTHDRLTVAEVQAAREAHPEAELLVHPECQPEVVAMADFVASTTGLINYAVQSPKDSFIVATEAGVLHPLTTQAPHKHFYMASSKLICPNMKMTTLEKILWSLQDMEPRITVDAPIREKALASLERMLALA
ncbi:quinolinate synthase NadA [Heliophilum fasciatum]|uniref:Quinolinate synthase n=1 Tax=Heliophilum fasciatum TaxID=35700 RepID=A0A4R2S7M2_9FIRM|nr:quinolinate synthase NadA [Heliophilum fasciatum]MCW2277073.1 quinolinate synthase [Heliophilum fasciatum]TCP68401.1 quinolinate synthetase [Heliophilum fasciatum]